MGRTNHVSGTPRQMADDGATITLSGSYTPWGDILEHYGKDSFTRGYYGGLLDLTNGLIYLGNDQYYDAETGHFLTRQVKPGAVNPYLPDLSGLLMGPLGVVTMERGRRRKGRQDYRLASATYGSGPSKVYLHPKMV